MTDNIPVDQQSQLFDPSEKRKVINNSEDGTDRRAAQKVTSASLLLLTVCLVRTDF